MRIDEILKDIDYKSLGAIDKEIEGITFDSRKAAKGMVFVAQKGVHTDGHQYINNVIDNGVEVIVCEQMPTTTREGVSYIEVKNSDEALGKMARNYYGDPTKKLKLIGITGTNGKTTTVTLLHQMMRKAGHHAGLISTIVNKIDDQEIATHHTTPDALSLNALLSEMAEQGCEYCFMEVSSHAVVQQRISGLTFAGGIFSNITHDHLDYHKTMANYIAAKKGFFDSLPSNAFALTNIDDKNGMVMMQNCKANVKSYSLKKVADFGCKVIENTFEGLLLQIDNNEIWTRLVGTFNAYNLTAIYATAVLLGIEKSKALLLLSSLEPARGRFEYVRGRGKTAIVDYAHTPDALENVLNTINAIRTSTQEVITVIGCGGDRDRSKRPEMAQIAMHMSNKVVLTSDNPRTEDPEQILNEMENGLTDIEKSRAIRIGDRRQAIKTACMIAKEGDIILVAGKGHETYQEVNGERSHFDDKEELEKILK